MIKVISFTICPFVQRITAILEAKKIPYDIEFISLKDKPQWFLALSPNGQVPVLVSESNTAIFESDAIAEYLDDAYLTLESNITPEQKALDRAWSYQATKHYLTQCSAMRSSDLTTLQERQIKLNTLFKKADEHITLPYFNGDNLSNVDMAWLPLLHRAEIINEQTYFDFLKDFPRVQQWQQALANTGLFRRSVADDFEEKFISFYLSSETYLGDINNPLRQTLSEDKPVDSCQTGTCC